MRFLLILLGTCAVAYVGVALLVFFQQRALLYPAPPDAREPRLPGADLVRLQGPGGLPVVALHLPAYPGVPTVVHFHGNAEQLADTVHLAWRYQQAGLGFYAVEYPGYGLAAGTGPSESAFYAAAETALTHLHGPLGVPVERTVLQGQSLGSGTAVEMARRGLGSRLILLSPYTSIGDMGARLLPWLPARLLVRDRFDNAAKAPALRLPALVLHGTEDEVVPVDMGQQLARLLPQATLHLVEGAWHNDLLEASGVVRLLTEFALDQRPAAAGE
jgi:uncharacterized protein